METGILFDLDGTLWDSALPAIQAWNRVLDTCPDIPYRITLQDMEGFMGKTVEEIAGLFFTNVSRERGLEIIYRCCDEERIFLARHGAVLYPGVKETLEALALDYPLFIVSNCHTGYIEAFFSGHGLGHFFRDYELSGRTGRPKGENIRLLLERNRLDRGVYVGDTQGDFQAASFAGLPFIHAGYGFGQMTMGEPYGRLSAIGELPPLISRLFPQE